MSSEKKPIAVIFELANKKCSFSGKKSEGVVVSLAGRPRQHLSWAAFRKLLEFRYAKPEAAGEKAPA